MDRYGLFIWIEVCFVKIHNAAGTAKITATTTNGKTTTATITVPSVATLKTFTELRPSKINWIKYYFDGKVLQSNVEKYVYNNEYRYVVPSIHMLFSLTSFYMGLPDSDLKYTKISAPLTQGKGTPYMISIGTWRNMWKLEMPTCVRPREPLPHLREPSKMWCISKKNITIL